MAKLKLELQPDTCPLFRASAMLMDAQRARIHALGEGEKVEIDASCIGPNCMAYVTTGLHPETKKPIGGCGLAVGPVYLVQLNRNIEALNLKIDTLITSGVEAAIGTETAEVLPAGGFLERFAAKLKTFFAQPDDTPAKPEPPKLQSLDGGKD